MAPTRPNPSSPSHCSAAVRNAPARAKAATAAKPSSLIAGRLLTFWPLEAHHPFYMLRSASDSYSLDLCMPLCLSRRWHLRQLIAASSLILLVACAEKPTAADAQPLQTVPVVPAPAIIPPVVPSGDNLDIQPTQTFAEWEADFRKEALAAGIRPDVFDRAFANVSFDESVIRADRSQPEFSRPVWEYLDGALSPLRVRNGQSLLVKYADILQRIEDRYGVDRQALVSVWGMESNFGQFQGNNSVKIGRAH